MWLQCALPLLSFILLKPAECIVEKFNASLPDYSINENTANLTNVQTLHKHLARYADFAPVRNPIRFKEIPDNAISSSSHSRGLLHHDSHHGYGLLDYDDGPHYGHGHDYYIHDPDHDHDYVHHDGHHDSHHYGHHHLSYGHHHKHVDHTLAAKTVLWPIAGIALLGAAAALVSNPVLLQLGVVSGRRKRREAESYELNPDFIRNWSKSKQEEFQNKNTESNTSDPDVTKEINRYFVKDSGKRQVSTKTISNNKIPSKITVKRNLGDNLHVNYKESDDEKYFIRVPLKTND